MNRRTTNTKAVASFEDAVLPNVERDQYLIAFEVVPSQGQSKQVSAVSLGLAGTLHEVEQHFCKSCGMD